VGIYSTKVHGTARHDGHIYESGGTLLLKSGSVMTVEAGATVEGLTPDISQVKGISRTIVGSVTRAELNSFKTVMTPPSGCSYVVTGAYLLAVGSFSGALFMAGVAGANTLLLWKTTDMADTNTFDYRNAEGSSGDPYGVANVGTPQTDPLVLKAIAGTFSGGTSVTFIIDYVLV